MVFTQSTHPLEMAVAFDENFTSIIIDDTINTNVGVNYSSNCLSEKIVIYIEVEDEVHDSTNLTINDPTFELCGMDLVDTSLVNLTSTSSQKVWKYSFKVKQTSERTTSQLLIKVTEANEGPNESTSPFSVTRLLNITLDPASLVEYNGTNLNKPTEVITFQITNPTDIYLGVRDQIDAAIETESSDVIGDVEVEDCDVFYTEVQIKLNREIYPCFFDKDCEKFLFNYKRVDGMDWCPLDSFDSNNITADIGVNTLTYRVVNKKTGNVITNSNNDEIQITKIIMFNPVIHIQESHVTIPTGQSKYDSNSDLIPYKGDVIECIFPDNGTTISDAKDSKTYKPKISVIVWHQGAKPGDSTPDYKLSMDPQTTLKYFDDNMLIDIIVTSYNLVLNEDTLCLDLSECSQFNLNYNEFKSASYLENENVHGDNQCAEAPLYKVTLSFHNEVCATHMWDCSLCKYVPIEQGELCSEDGIDLNDLWNAKEEAYVKLQTACRRVEDQACDLSNAETQNAKYQVSAASAEALDASYTCLMDKYDSYKIAFTRSETFDALTASYEQIRDGDNSDLVDSSNALTDASGEYDIAFSTVQTDLSGIKTWIETDLSASIAGLASADLSDSTLDQLTAHALQVQNVFADSLRFNDKSIELVQSLGSIINRLSAMQSLLLDLSGSDIEVNATNGGDYDDLMLNVSGTLQALELKYDSIITTLMTYTDMSLNVSAATLSGNYDLSGGLSVTDMSSNLVVTVTPSWEIVVSEVTMDVSYVQTASYEVLASLTDISFTDASGLISLDVSYSLTEIEARIEAANIIQSITADFSGTLGASGNIIIDLSLGTTDAVISYYDASTAHVETITYISDSDVNISGGVFIIIDPSGTQSDIIDLSNARRLNQTVVELIHGGLSWNELQALFSGASELSNIVSEISGNAYLHDVSSNLTVSLVDEQYQAFLTSVTFNSVPIEIESFTYVAQVTDLVSGDIDIFSDISLDVQYSLSEFTGLIDSSGTVELTNILIQLYGATGSLQATFNNEDDGFNTYITNVVQSLYAYSDLLAQSHDLSNALTVQAAYDSYLEDISGAASDAQNELNTYVSELTSIRNDMSGNLTSLISFAVGITDDTQESMDVFNAAKNKFLADTKEYYTQTSNYYTDLEDFLIKSKAYFEADAEYEANRAKAELANDLANLYAILAARYSDEKDACVGVVTSMVGVIADLNTEFLNSLLLPTTEYQPDPNSLYTASNFLPLNGESIELFTNLKGVMDNVEATKDWLQQIAMKESMLDNETKLAELLAEKKQVAQDEYDVALQAWQNLFDQLKAAGVFSVNQSLFDRISINMSERYIYFHVDDSQTDLHLEYNGTLDNNNSLIIDDLMASNENKEINVKYGSENAYIIGFEVKQSLTKYPEGQIYRTVPTISKSQNDLNKVIVNNSKPHEFIIKITTPVMSSNICELSGCLTTLGTIYEPKSITEMFNIELAYNEPNSAKLYLERGELVRKFNVISGPFGNQIDEGIIYDLFTQKDAGILYPGLKYTDPIIGTYFLNDDYIQYSVYVESVKLVAGTRSDTTDIVIDDNLGLTVLLKDYKLTHAKLVNAGLRDGCLPNDLLGFKVTLNYNTLAKNDHNDNDSRTADFFFYHSNVANGFTVSKDVVQNSETQQAICIQFVVSPFVFKDYETQLLTKCLRHNPNFRNTNVGTGTPNPDDILVQGTETYTQYDTLYVTPRLAESDGVSNTDWLDTPVQHDNGSGKAEYNTGLELCFTTNYGNDFVMQAIDMANGATNVTQNVNHNYTFNGNCLQITNVMGTQNLPVNVTRSTQDPLFRYEIGDIADPSKLTSARNAALDMTYGLSYTDFQGFPHTISQEFKWNISLCPIVEPTLHMDSIQLTLMNNENESLCRPFWMRSTEFGGWVKHAYERKLMQDITVQEPEPTHAEIDANGEAIGLDSSMVPLSHMYIDNQGEFHTQYGERVWIDSFTVDASNCPNQSITLNGKGVNVVGMEATASVSVDVNLVCEQEAPEFIGDLNHCINVAQNDALLQAIIDGSGSEHLQSLINLQVKYWDAAAYWESNEYLESEYADPNKVEENSVVNNNHEAVDFQKLTELSPEDVYTYDKSYVIDTTGHIVITYKETPESTTYSTVTLPATLAGFNLNMDQISVYTIPLIKVDKPECEGAPQKTTTTTIQINVQDTTKPVSTIVNAPFTADLTQSDNWLSQNIKVTHSRYVVEFAHYITEGYLWDKLTNNGINHCISIRELLAPTPLAYEATSEQLASSTMIRDTEENSLTLNADVTGVVSGCCGSIYNDTYVTHVEFVSDRNSNPNNIDVDFNGDTFTGQVTVDAFNSSELNVPIDGESGEYVITLTDSTHVLGDCNDVIGTGSADELNGELIIVESSSSLWNQTGLTGDQPFMAIATHNKQDNHRFNSLRMLARDVNMKYPTCGIVRVASRSIMPSNMTPECKVTVTNCNDLEFKSTLSDELLGGFCGLVEGDLILDSALVNDDSVNKITLGCNSGLDNSGNVSPVVFANLTGILALCEQLQFTVDASQCFQSRYTEFDENTSVRIACEELVGKNVTYEPIDGPNGEKAYVIKVDGDNYVLENKIINVQFVSKLVDYELFCRSFCTNVFTGAYDISYIKLMGSGDVNDLVCDVNDSVTRVIELTTCVVPQLSIIGTNNKSVADAGEVVVPNNNTHFSDADWNTFLNVQWNVSEQLKVDADGNSNIRVLIREILVEGTSHYQGDVNNVHLVYDQKQLISDVIANSHKIDSDDDLTRLFNNELEAGNASTLRIDANPGEQINVSYMAVAFMGEYISVSDIKTINYNIALSA